MKVRREKLAMSGVILLLACTMFLLSLRYDMGSMRSMGPGFFPVVLSILLGIGGILVALDPNPEPDIEIVSQLRPLSCVTAGVLAFSLTVERLGLITAVVLLVFLSLAGRIPFRFVSAVKISVVLAVGSYLIFVLGLGMNLKAVWWQ